MFSFLLFLPTFILGGEPVIGDIGSHVHSLEETMKGFADKKIAEQLDSGTSTSNGSWPQLLNFTDKDGLQIASMRLGSPVSVDLTATKCQTPLTSDGKCCSGKSSTENCLPGLVIMDKSKVVNLPLDGELTPSATSETVNETSTLKLTISITDIKTNMTAGLEVTKADIVLTVTTRGDTRPDYWNLTEAILSLTGSFNGTELPSSTDITPKSGYSPGNPACTAPYSICAPSGLSWTCGDQVFIPTLDVVNSTGLDGKTVMFHIPDLMLQLGNSTEEVYNWDCDPLIPISIWVTVLITLFLATFLFWGIYMLASQQTPSRFDDPKGPSIHVPTAE